MIQISRNGELGYYVPSGEIGNVLGEVEVLAEYDEIGETLELKVVELTTEEYYKLPEFEGW